MSEQNNVILTGFMGTGKTAVGQQLAAILGYEFVDTDTFIEAREGRTVAAIFAQDGEAAFRRLERDCAQAFSERRGLVISTGGGMMLAPENVASLGGSGSIFCLTADVEELWRRLAASAGQRPLLDVPEPRARLTELLAERAPGYARFPQVDTTGKTARQVAEELALMMDKTVLDVSYPGGRYAVIVGDDLLTGLRSLAGIGGPYVVISDDHVGPLYAAQCPDAAAVITFPAGETHKTLDTVRELYDRLLSAGADRKTTIVALGGGVTGDVAGFVAATYMRGVDFVQCPTSLLAMVDASVGAKTGVDLPQGKNLVGAFKQPTAVLADLRTLQTLPPPEYASGMAEVIKSAVIGDPELFFQMERMDSLILPRNEAEWAALADMVTRSIRVKRDVVEEDPFEQGRRAVLNLGHTFGHAIEQVSGYKVRHGEAVAMGMIAAAHLAARLGRADETLGRRIRALLSKAQLPAQIPDDLQADALYAAMGSDKKKADGRLRFILPHDVGDVRIAADISGEDVLATLRDCGAG